jgi:hypothetical protein
MVATRLVMAVYCKYRMLRQVAFHQLPVKWDCFAIFCGVRFTWRLNMVKINNRLKQRTINAHNSVQ